MIMWKQIKQGYFRNKRERKKDFEMEDVSERDNEWVSK